MCFRFLQYHDIYKKIFNIKYIYNVMKYKLLSLYIQCDNVKNKKIKKIL